MATKQTKIAKVEHKVTRVSSIISATIVIISAATGLCAWISNQFQSVVSEQIAELRSEMEVSDKRTDQQITRLELLNLIHNQPNNKAEIEKVAKYYFKILDGDWYATGIYSEWADSHDGDVSIIIGKD